MLDIISVPSLPPEAGIEIVDRELGEAPTRHVWVFLLDWYPSHYPKGEWQFLYNLDAANSKYFGFAEFRRRDVCAGTLLHSNPTL
jgi:hypothetical protein